MKSSRNTEGELQQTHIKQLYGGLCTNALRQINWGKGEPEAGSGWTREENATYGVTTWTYTASEDKRLRDPATQQPLRVGSNGKLEVKVFAKDAYDFVKTENFLERGELIIDAAQALVAQYANNPALMNNLKLWLDNLKKEYVAFIKTNCAIDPKEIRAENSEHFNEMHDRAKNAMRQLMSNAAGGLHAVAEMNGIKNSKNENITRDDVMNAMVQAEKEHVMHEGRSAVIKLGYTGENNSQLMVSAQYPQGDKTLPSTLRTGEDDDDYKLSNHVIDGSGAVLKREDGQQEIQFDVMIDGHSSYVPIQEPDFLKRVYVGCQALQEKIAATARDLQAVRPELGRDSEHPLEISIASMILLTPQALKNVEKIFLKNESETDQVNEMRLTFDLMRRQKQPMVITGADGRAIFVKVNHTYLNIPANETMVSQRKLKIPKLQININSKGFYEFSREMMNKLSGLNSRNFDELQKLDKDLVLDMMKLNGKLNDINQDGKTSNVEIESMSKLVYENLASYYESGDKNLVKGLEKSINRLDKMYSELDDEFTKAMDARKENVLAESEKRKNVMERIDKLLAKPTLSSDIREHLILQRRFLVAEEMYFKESYLQPENAFTLQAMYLLSLEQLGYHLETLCKSGEDRTGWMRVTLLALTAHRRIHGHDPDFSDPEQKSNFQKLYLDAASELAASRETTSDNSKASGFQVSRDLTIPHKPMEYDRKNAILAKGVYSDRENLPSCKFSFNVTGVNFIAVHDDQLNVSLREKRQSKRDSQRLSRPSSINMGSNSMVEGTVPGENKRRGSIMVNLLKKLPGVSREPAPLEIQNVQSVAKPDESISVTAGDDSRNRIRVK